jgi:hypothetical protein
MRGPEEHAQRIFRCGGFNCNSWEAGRFRISRGLIRPNGVTPRAPLFRQNLTPRRSRPYSPCTGKHDDSRDNQTDANGPRHPHRLAPRSEAPGPRRALSSSLGPCVANAAQPQHKTQSGQKTGTRRRRATSGITDLHSGRKRDLTANVHLQTQIVDFESSGNGIPGAPLSPADYRGCYSATSRARRRDRSAAVRRA